MRELAAAASSLSATVGSFGQDRRQDARDAAVVGAEPIENIVMMEDHDGAYYAWKQAGMTGRILLHIDTHMDWNWIAEKDPLDILKAESLKEIEPMLEERCLWNLSERKSKELVHIGNYIYPALREGIVSEFYWIVPDGLMDSPRTRRSMLRTFQRMMAVNPRSMKILGVEKNRIIVEIAGSRVTTCRLSDLPPIHEPVLLDIDTDFLVGEFGESARAGNDPWKQLPWIWPEELIARLKDKGVRTDFVTIAYSVEGGFTPLSYKYLGDELALRLKHPTLPERQRQVIAHKRRGAGYRHVNELDHAIAECEKAVTLAPEDASSHFHLAYLYDEQGSSDQAAARYRQAVQLDPTYATAYNTFGSLYRSLGLLDHAQEEYQRILRWDPQNVNAQYGLAEILAQHERWEEATRLYRTVMEYCPDHADAHGGLGSVYAKRGMWDEAISQLKRAIALQPSAGRAYCWLGVCYARLQQWDGALEAYRGALRCGMRTVTIYRRLGGLYLRKGMVYKAFQQYRKGLRLWGWLSLSSIRERSRMLLEMLSREGEPCSP
jgi:tetratricopeptide (TPR) repeat protein